MAGLSFINNLDQNQLDNLDLVVKHAKEVGVDPRLAVSLAYAETKLRHMNGDRPTIGTSGEVGLMQVKPDTAKQMGFDPRDLEDPEMNAKIGLTYLKNHLTRYNDPVLATMAYNAGPDHPFLKGESDTPPSQEYVNRIQSFGGFEPTPQDQNTPQAQTTEQPTPPTDWARDIATGAMGAGVGASLGAAKSTKDLVSNIVKTIHVPAPPPSNATSGTNWIKNWGGIDKEIEGGVPAGAATYNRMKGQGTVSGRQTKMWGPIEPGKSRVDQILEKSAPLAEASPLDRVTNLFTSMMKAPIVKGALGGAGVGFSANEMANRIQNKDPVGAAIAGAGALGSLGSMIPGPQETGIPEAMAVASPAALYLLDKMREQQLKPAPLPKASEQAPSFGGT